jgi:predicted nucleotidyltransferase
MVVTRGVVFTRFVNYVLQGKLTVEDLSKDMANGVAFAMIVEKLFQTHLKNLETQSPNNVQKAKIFASIVDYLKSINVDCKDVTQTLHC